MEITVKDILSIGGLSENLAESLANKIVEKNLYDKEQDEDTLEFYSTLKISIKEDLKILCSNLIKEELNKILKDSYDVRNIIKNTLEKYISAILEEKMKNIKDFNF